MRFASVTPIEAQFEVYLRLGLEGPVVVTKNGKPVAVLLAVEDEDESWNGCSWNTRLAFGKPWPARNKRFAKVREHPMRPFGLK